MMACAPNGGTAQHMAHDSEGTTVRKRRVTRLRLGAGCRHLVASLCWPHRRRVSNPPRISLPLPCMHGSARVCAYLDLRQREVLGGVHGLVGSGSGCVLTSAHHLQWCRACSSDTCSIACPSSSCMCDPRDGDGGVAEHGGVTACVGSASGGCAAADGTQTDGTARQRNANATDPTATTHQATTQQFKSINQQRIEGGVGGGDGDDMVTSASTTSAAARGVVCELPRTSKGAVKERDVKQCIAKCAWMGTMRRDDSDLVQHEAQQGGRQRSTVRRHGQLRAGTALDFARAVAWVFPLASSRPAAAIHRAAVPSVRSCRRTRSVPARRIGSTARC